MELTKVAELNEELALDTLGFFSKQRSPGIFFENLERLSMANNTHSKRYNFEKRSNFYWAIAVKMA